MKRVGNHDTDIKLLDTRQANEASTYLYKWQYLSTLTPHPLTLETLKPPILTYL